MTSMASSADYDAQRRPVIDIDDDGVDDLKASLTSSRRQRWTPATPTRARVRTFRALIRPTRN